MKCFLHIGTEKTATTTIQTFFDINRNSLKDKGFIYTKSAGKRNNRALSVAAYSIGRRDEFTRQNNFDSDDKLTAFQRTTICNLAKEITEVKKWNKGSSLIFSSEHFQSRLTKIEEITRLKEIVCSFGVTDISVIVYLRRPAEIANSLYSTAIKKGKYLEEPPSPKHPYWRNVCNHKGTIERFASVFGESSIIPKLFDKSEFINGSIIDDLLSTISVPNDVSYRIPDDANRSLSLTGVQLLKRLNKTVPKWIDNKTNPARSNLASYIEKYFSDSKYIMPSRLYKDFDVEFKESNEWIREKYFPEKDAIFSEKIPKGVASDIPELELDRIANLIANIWNDKLKK